MLSLRTFHIFFILISSALCIFLIFWGIYDFKVSGGAMGLTMTGLGLVGGFLLTRYYKWFKQKNFKAASLILGLSLYSSVSEACSVCYTDPNSSLTKGALIGVIVLGTIITSVLVFIVIVARQWLRRARDLAEEF